MRSEHALHRPATANPEGEDLSLAEGVLALELKCVDRLASCPFWIGQFQESLLFVRHAGFRAADDTPEARQSIATALRPDLFYCVDGVEKPLS